MIIKTSILILSFLCVTGTHNAFAGCWSDRCQADRDYDMNLQHGMTPGAAAQIRQDRLYPVKPGSSSRKEPTPEEQAEIDRLLKQADDTIQSIENRGLTR